VSPTASARPPAHAAAPAHTVIVIMENSSYSQIIGNPAAPYINGLARHGALFTNSHAITHPSEPNYLALFSGSTQGITDDSCPHTFTGPDLASELIAAHRTFAGYAEGLPPGGATVCSAGEYARKHVPWADFTNVPPSATHPMSAFPAAPPGYARLPTVSFVIPNLCHDMHDCPVSTGDGWLRAHLSGYASWAMTHDSLLIVDWDENDGSPGNQIATIFAGQHVRPGRYAEPVTHYGVLRTLEYLYRLPALGAAATARPITYIWK
jgi:acid phosphatase